MRRLLPLFALTSLLLAGCDQLGIESVTASAERRSADGKAVGAACRHAARAIEDCYTLNKKTDKAAIYAGWREMDDYMRENKIEPVIPLIKPVEPKPKPAEGEEGADAPEASSAKASAEKSGADKPAKKPAGH